MLIGLDKIDITPSVGTPMGGNVRVDNLSRGVHDPLCANIVVLKANDYACFIEVDLIGIHKNICDRIKTVIHNKTEIPISNIMISAIHTHSGPDTAENRKDDILSEVKPYLEGLVEKIAAGVEKAAKNMVQGKIGIGKGYVDGLSFNRRIWMKDGTLHMNWENIKAEEVEKPAGPIDPEIYVIKLTDMEDKVICVMVNFTLHAAVLVGKDWLFSRDYIHGLDERLKEVLGNEVQVFFANGAEGNVNHINVWDSHQGRDFEEARLIGEALAEKVLSGINDIRTTEECCISCMAKELDMELRQIPAEEIEKAAQLLESIGDKKTTLLDGVPEEEYARDIMRLSRMGKHVTTMVQVIRINDSIIAALPGEAFVEFGLRIKCSSLFKNTMIFGLANDYIGYIPTAEAFDQGGYEPKTCKGSKLTKEAGDIFVKEILQMVKKWI